MKTFISKIAAWLRALISLHSTLTRLEHEQRSEHKYVRDRFLSQGGQIESLRNDVKKELRRAIDAVEKADSERLSALREDLQVRFGRIRTRGL
jgi:hypothetical protein